MPFLSEIGQKIVPFRPMRFMVHGLRINVLIGGTYPTLFTYVRRACVRACLSMVGSTRH